MLLPSGAPMVISSSCFTVCSAVTITPSRQWTPLEGSRGRAWTVTTERPARSTAPASSFESATNVFSILHFS